MSDAVKPTVSSLLLSLSLWYTIGTTKRFFSILFSVPPLIHRAPFTLHLAERKLVLNLTLTLSMLNLRSGDIYFRTTLFLILFFFLLSFFLSPVLLFWFVFDDIAVDV